MHLYLTPAAVGYLTQLILAVLISGYVLWRVAKPGRPQHTLWLAGFFISITVFLTTLFLEVALLPTQRLGVVYCQNAALGIALVFLIQFAYRFPALVPAHRWEALLALGCSSLYTLWEAQYAVYRFGLLRSGIVEFRPGWSDYLLLAMLLWVPAAFLRQLYALDRSGSGLWQRLYDPLVRPANREARTMRDLALIFLFVASLNVFNILRAMYLLTVSLANMGISLGILLALLAFALIYLNGQTETVSFIVKFAGVILTVMLAILGVVGWVVAPLSAARYRPQFPLQHTLRFTPNARGGYDIADVPWIFESDAGEDLRLADSVASVEEHAAYCSEPLLFAFPFYGQVYRQLYVCNDGTIGMGQPLPHRNYQYRYGSSTPLIMALLTDLNPDISPGAVYARQEPGRLIVTWERQRAFRYPQNEATFQARLYADGVFEFSYLELPSALVYQPNDDPSANPWAIGALPGGADITEPEQVNLGELPLSSGPLGVIQDFNLEFRQHLHEFLTPLARLTLVASAFIALGLPLLISTNLVQPLTALLQGVRQMEAGSYQVHVPVRFADEIGFLTRAFNTLAVELDTLIHDLEMRVAARTEALDEANAQLRAEVAAREELITELKAFSHTVAHDLKTPLAVIIGYSALMHELLSESGDPELVKYSQKIANTGAKMGHMIDGILAFASVRQADLKLVSLDMAAIVEEVKCNLQPAITQAKACITHPEYWPPALGKPQWIEEIWSNYLSNALKYGGRPAEGFPPCVELGYSVSNLELPIAGSWLQLAPAIPESLQSKIKAPQSKIIFWVRDQGPGIAVELQARLFTPYDQLDGKTPDGHGLGLSIVKRMVEKLGGEVGVESAPGAGSCFWFTLAVDVAALAAMPATSSAAFDALAARLARLDAALLTQLAQSAQSTSVSDLQTGIAQLKCEDLAAGEAFDVLLYHFDYEMILGLVNAALARQHERTSSTSEDV